MTEYQKFGAGLYCVPETDPFFSRRHQRVIVMTRYTTPTDQSGEFAITHAQKKAQEILQTGAVASKESPVNELMRGMQRRFVGILEGIVAGHEQAVLEVVREVGKYHVKNVIENNGDKIHKLQIKRGVIPFYQFSIRQAKGEPADYFNEYISRDPNLRSSDLGEHQRIVLARQDDHLFPREEIEQLMKHRVTLSDVLYVACSNTIKIPYPETMELIHLAYREEAADEQWVKGLVDISEEILNQILRTAMEHYLMNHVVDDPRRKEKKRRRRPKEGELVALPRLFGNTPDDETFGPN